MPSAGNKMSAQFVVPLDTKGCICHLTKWQIHPLISKGTLWSFIKGVELQPSERLWYNNWSAIEMMKNHAIQDGCHFYTCQVLFNWDENVHVYIFACDVENIMFIVIDYCLILCSCSPSTTWHDGSSFNSNDPMFGQRLRRRPNIGSALVYLVFIGKLCGDEHYIVFQTSYF